MAEIKLTTDQKAVVDSRDCSLLVAAAAGSGKTAVLVRRIIERLTNPDKPARLDKLLIVTFTKAAAAEMRERIGKALEEAIQENPDDDNLRCQMAMLPTAQISTIDSFCMSVVKENYHALSIDPGFTIADENELSLLGDDILEELLEEEYEKSSEAFLKLLSAYTTHKNDSNLKKYILQLYGFAESDPRPEDWLKKAEDSFLNDTNDALYNGVVEEAKHIIADCLNICNRGINICRQENGPVKILQTFLPEADFMDRMLKARDFKQLQDMFVTEMTFSKINTYTAKQAEKEGVIAALNDECKEIRDKYKNVLQGLRGDYFSLTKEEADEIYRKCAPAMLELIRLTREFMLRFDAAKAERNTYNFADVAHFAHKVLCDKDEAGNTVPTVVARALAKRYDEIMIDEYQDSSFIQEDMLSCVSGEFGAIPNLFMVGDVKQSIYGFRKARPELFNHKYATFEREGLHKKIDLDKNFRSRKCVLDSVNVMLSAIMHKDITEIEYDEHAALHFGSGSYTEDNEQYNTEFVIIDKDASEEELEQVREIYDLLERIDSSGDEKLTAAKTSALEREALWVGLKIKEMVNSGFPVSAGVVDGEAKTRPVGYGDFAILSRAVGGGISEVFSKVFSKLHIPISVQTDKGFFESIEVQKVLAFLRILDNPYQDIPIAAVLYSPIVGFSADDLANLYINYVKKTKKKCSLYECVLQAAADGNEGLQKFLCVYKNLLEMSEYSTVHEVLQSLYELTGYMDVVSVQPQGDRRAGNLEQLIKIVKSFEKSTFAGIHDFIRYVDRLIENAKDFGEAALEGSDSSVRMMTIHKSKGLEFPVVFLCRAGLKFNTSDVTGNLIFDQEFGIGSNYVDVDKRTKQKTLKQFYLQNRKSRIDKAEEVRVLYVALTRAKEKLYIVGTYENCEKKLDSWRKALVNGMMTYSDVGSAQNYIDLLAPVLFNGCSEEELNDFAAGSICRNITGVCGTESFSADFKLTHHHFDENDAYRALENGGEAENNVVEETESFMDKPGIREEIEARKTYVYPYSEKASAPSKVSVSELKMLAIHEAETEEVVEIEPVTKAISEEEDKAERKGATGALRGTLYHEVFEKLRYAGDYSSADAVKTSLEKEIEALIEEKYLPSDILDTVKIPKLTAFCMSSVGQRMIEAYKADTLYREQPFVYGLSNEEYRKFSRDDRETDTVMLQGIIDAYIDEPDGLVLIDYKTDKVIDDAARELTERYQVQLELYARALAKLRRKPVKEKIIYSVAKNEVIVLP